MCHIQGSLLFKEIKEEGQPLIVQNMTKKKNIKLRETEDYTAINILSKAAKQTGECSVCLKARRHRKCRCHTQNITSTNKEDANFVKVYITGALKPVPGVSSLSVSLQRNVEQVAWIQSVLYPYSTQ